MVGSKRTRSKTAAMAQSVTAQSHSSHDPAVDVVAPPPHAAINPQQNLATAPQLSPHVAGTTTIKKNPSHQFNLCKKPNESLQDYIKRFKAEKAKIVGCDDQIASFAFKNGLPVEHDLYRELTITPSQTLAEVFATAKCHALWDEDRIVVKKFTKQEDQPTKCSGQRSDRFSSRDKDKRRSHPRRCYDRRELHQVLHPHTSNPSPCEGQTLGKKTVTLERRSEQEGYQKILCLPRDVVQQIENRDTTKEPPQKVIRINTILVDSEESGLTSKEKKRKIKHATMISQVSTRLPLAEDNPVIDFQKKDLIDLDLPHNEALVINIQITQAMVDRIHADEGSTSNILQLAIIQQMGLETKINKSTRLLTSFNSATKVTVGMIKLDVYSLPVISSQTFMVIDEVSPYNGILGRPWIGKINAITSPSHQKILYPILGGGVGQINRDQIMEVSIEEGWKPEDDVELVPLDLDKPERKAWIAWGLSQEEKVELVAFFQNNKDLFAWSPSNKPDINPQIICHHLHVNPAIKPIAQKRPNFSPKRVAIIEAKIDNLLAADFIKKVFYT
ncbi:uncharacterized protein LOC110769801 [Prunus avium]|uniref:Uncharacterized protein LOC110769801 n=1 Tax=Prunus avium TaxID=42229 RepID=A0A6P5TQU1_PRUAV|nr:uncharacterized protein LOC110769801 [Prunus avium]